jgi:lipopolysaccharide biosynthesis glycosyltransferase
VFVLGKKEKREAFKLMSCNVGRSNERRWFVSEFNTEYLSKIRIRAPNDEKRGNLASPMNYGRFYLHRMLGTVEKVVMIDVDTVVAGDITILYDSALVHNDFALAAVARPVQDACKHIHCDDPRLDQINAKELHDFNAGVLVFNLKRWAAQNLTETVEFWLKLNYETALYELGSNPPLILAIRQV